MEEKNHSQKNAKNFEKKVELNVKVLENRCFFIGVARPEIIEMAEEILVYLHVLNHSVYS